MGEKIRNYELMDFQDYFIEQISRADEAKYKGNENSNIQKGIEELLNRSRNLYWEILKNKEEGIEINTEYQNVLETAIKYAQISSTEMGKNGNYEEKTRSELILKPNEPHTHIINEPKAKVAVKMRSFFSFFPLLTINEIKSNWSSFLEAPSVKIFFTLIFSIITLFIGDSTVLSLPLFILVIIHTLTRYMANKHLSRDNYVTFSRNIQLFIWPYILLAVGNALNFIVTINGLPEDTFIAILTVWIIWGELKGIIENAEICGLSVPPILKKIVSKKDDNDISPL